MSVAYDVTAFDLEYCQTDVSKIASAIKSQNSLLVIGMPGCGKSRLIDFLLHRPGVLEKYGLTHSVKFFTVDGDTLTTNPQDIYFRLLRALDPEVKLRPAGGVEALKDRLMTAVENFEQEINLVVIFDSFRQRLQQTLGEDFFNFLHGLRNSRPKLNLSYIFMANLEIDRTGFYKIERLFNQSADRSICWLSLFNKQDAFFSIERQWHAVKEKPKPLSENKAELLKERIYKLTGGHALLTKYLAHLMLSQDILPSTTLADILDHSGIRATCAAIWNDLDQIQKNLLIDLTQGMLLVIDEAQILKKYGVLTKQGDFFSPIFECFVKEQEKVGEVIRVGYDEAKTRIIIHTIDERQIPFTINPLVQRKRKLLCCLIENLGETCTKDQLKDVGWTSDDKEGVTDQALGRQIDDIRKWLNQQRQLSQYIDIETDWGVGYKLVVKSEF